MQSPLQAFKIYSKVLETYGSIFRSTEKHIGNNVGKNISAFFNMFFFKAKSYECQHSSSLKENEKF